MQAPEFKVSHEPANEDLPAHPRNIAPTEHRHTEQDMALVVRMSTSARRDDVTMKSHSPLVPGRHDREY